jgi:hypothetical protein
VQPAPELFHNLNELPKRTAVKTFRPADPHNLPLEEARQRFLQTLADHSPILEELFAEPLRLWMSLTPAAAKLCGWECPVLWFDILYCPQWTEIDPGLANDPKVVAEQKANLELLPLRSVLLDFASKFNLMYNGEPAVWAMGTIMESLIWRARHPNSERTRGWVHPTNFSQEYPALTEEGWVSAKTGLPEEEIFMIVIEVPPKQPGENFKSFEKRFNRVCRQKRQEYIRGLKAAEWTSVAPIKDFTWIDCLAQWQAGRSYSEIDPSVNTHVRRAAFSRALSKASRYIQITLRLSKHNPKPLRKH